jgi:hypothetical protein
LKSRTCEDTESWTCETMKSGIYDIQESTKVEVRRLWLKISWIRDSWISKKPSKDIASKIRVWCVN